MFVELPVKWFAHLREENIAVNQSDRAVTFHYSKTDHVASRRKNFHCQGVRISGIDYRKLLTQIAGATRDFGHAGATKLR
jgi:hypothetical protein